MLISECERSLTTVSYFWDGKQDWRKGSAHIQAWAGPSVDWNQGEDTENTFEFY